jgi:hypothetical protein
VLARERVHLLRRELHHLRRWGSGFSFFGRASAAMRGISRN